MPKPLILVSNPGSASRKYALFEGENERADIHFEYFKGRILCTYVDKDKTESPEVNFSDVREAASHVVEIFKKQGALQDGETISRIGLRIVAPGKYFLSHRLIDDESLGALRHLNSQSPIHIGATLDELELLRVQFSDTPVIGVSDSAFHITKPDYAWNYGLPLEDADRFDIKRFGFHGLSTESITMQLQKSGYTASKVIVAHLGSGASISAIEAGHSVDNTMGYSPLEGAIMATRSGSVDLAAAQTLKHTFNYNDAQLNAYLNLHSGLLGLGGSNDIRELLRREESGDHRSHLALSTYIYSIQKAIGQMAAALNGVDALVFTGTVGERSAAVRSRIIDRLNYLGLSLDTSANSSLSQANNPQTISTPHSKSVIVAPAQENTRIAHYTATHSLD